MNVTIQIPSTKKTTRGIASPRRNLISTRPISPRKRVQQIRKLPSLDTRSLIANPNLEYSQPAYILEQKLQLIPEVEALRKEVTLLRENYQLLLNSIQQSQKETDPDSDPQDEEREIYDEIAQHELSKKLSNYQAEYEELERRISSYNSNLTDENENDLNNYVTAQKALENQLQQQIENDLNLTQQKEEKLQSIKSTNYCDKVDQNDIKISQLTELLQDLRQEETLMLKLHQDACQAEPSNIEANKEINFYLRKLQMAQHVHAKKLVDMKKMQKDLQQEKTAVIAIKKAKEDAEKKRQKLNTYHDVYKKQAKILEENSRANSQVTKNEEKPNTSLTKTRIKHKHKHWHHRRPNEETNSPETTSNVQNNMSVQDDLDLTKSPPPITFKTEVENSDTLHIGENAE